MNIWILCVCMENVREREWENCFSTMMAIQQVDWNEEQMNVNEMREKKHISREMKSTIYQRPH